MENDNNFGYGKIMILVDNMPLKGKNMLRNVFNTNIYYTAIILIQSKTPI